MTATGQALLPARVLSWLDHVLDGQKIQHAERLSGGYSNDNILIVTGAGHRYVLRRYARPDRCAVEAALAGRLRGVVPVAEAVAADPDGTSAGEPVLLSRYAPGVMLSRALAQSTRQDAAGLGRAAGNVLAAIGSVRFDAAGFFSGADLAPGPEPGGLPGGLPEFVDRCLRDGNAGHGLSPREQDGLRALALAAAPLAASVAGACQLVHSDYNAKNLLVAPGHNGWSVTAVLDWEFAYSGSPLADIGNMLRFWPEIPAPFADSFIAGYRGAGGDLAAEWRALSEALDLYALADFLTRPPDHLFFGKAVAAIRGQLRAAGRLQAAASGPGPGAARES